MSRATGLLEQAITAALDDSLGPPSDGMSAAMRRAIVASALDKFPAADYEAAVDALDVLLEALEQKPLWTREFQAARAALARLRDKVPSDV